MPVPGHMSVVGLRSNSVRTPFRQLQSANSTSPKSALPTNRAHVFSRMRSEGSRFIWGFGGEAVFAESCVYVRNRSQPFATVRQRPQPFA